MIYIPVSFDILIFPIKTKFGSLITNMLYLFPKALFPRPLLHTEETKGEPYKQDPIWASPSSVSNPSPQGLPLYLFFYCPSLASHLLFLPFLHYFTFFSLPISFFPILPLNLPHLFINFCLMLTLYLFFVHCSTAETHFSYNITANPNLCFNLCPCIYLTRLLI